ncbi:MULTISPECIES: RNA methyltransferase [unclassified Pseudonocardia]|uniref:TrmH family RNA methyltransferase n=1 Tax=unclassified Pseudonocardia TaxID=2619320 RepID=UPI0001FFEC49|nr:RNA methyltransferase [Pseudonocardia sp. Ae707_Ps1]OLM18163.1 rRNA methylase [Pseudonocardia sp. Ae707_Ps1]
MTRTETPGTERTPRVAAARKLLRRPGRDRAGRFLVEGAQAVREALDACPVHELFVTTAAAQRHPELVESARERGARVLTVTDQAAAGLSETVTPQGLVAVCDLLDVPLATALAGSPGFVTVCAGISDPGNVGTVVRVADAAGCDAVLLAGDTVDPHNGKAVRASTGSVFHLPLARDRDAQGVVAACRSAGLTTLVADGRGELDLHAPEAAPILAGPVAWILGSEAHGPGPDVFAAADHRVRVPIHGRAESLNLATAAAICLYATVGARAGAAPRPPSARD